MPENPTPKNEKNEVPAGDGLTWGKSLKLGAIGASSTAVGYGAVEGLRALGKRFLGRQVADEGARQAAAFGRRMKSLFSR